MDSRFNLIDEAWIPVVGAGRVGLREVFSNPGLTEIGGTPVQKIAITKLLLAIAQSAATPENDEEWLALGGDGLAQRCMQYLDRWRDRFFLYGDTPFLQVPAISVAEVAQWGAVQPEIATGNNKLVTQHQVQYELDDGERALVLLTLMACALGGNRVDNSVTLSAGYTRKSTNSKGGPAIGGNGLLHNFCLGNNLQTTVWLNLLSKENIASMTTFPGGLGVAPWEQMPTGENCAVAIALQRSLMGRLIPLCRFCLIAGAGLHYSEGIVHLAAKDGMVDPSVMANFSGAKPSVLEADPNRRPWRSLTSFLAFMYHQNSPFDCRQLRYAIPRARSTQEKFSIWSGGVSVTERAHQQLISGADDMVDSVITLHRADLGEFWFDAFTAEMANLSSMAKHMTKCMGHYYAELRIDAAKSRKKSWPASKFDKQATRLFWIACEHQLYPMIHACRDEGGRQAIAGIRRKLAGEMTRIFEQFCPRRTARQIDVWARTRPNVSQFLLKEKG